MSTHKELFKFVDKSLYKNIRETGIHNLYLSYPIAKSSGKKRWLDAPQNDLKLAQYQLLHNMLYNFTPHQSAIGFRPGISLLEGPKRHKGAKVILSLDIKDFFPSIGKDKVFQFAYWAAHQLKDLGLCENWSTSDYFTFVSLVTYKKHLPQGAPTSPVLSNLIGRILDMELEKIARSDNLIYTRYADDITFSSKDKTINMYKVYKSVESIITTQKYKVNKKKTRILRPHQRMSITGVTINEKFGVPKWKWRNFRAKLHNLKRSQKPISKLEYQQLIGYAQWIQQVHQKRGNQFLKEIGQLNLQN